MIVTCLFESKRESKPQQIVFLADDTVHYGSPKSCCETACSRFSLGESVFELLKWILCLAVAVLITFMAARPADHKKMSAISLEEVATNI